AVQEKVPPPPAPSVPTTRLRFVGSHDPAIGLLAEQLAGSRPRAALDVTFVGSLGGLMALARGEADVAGTHLWDETTDTYNEPFVRRLLPGQRLALVTLAQRSLGLILPAGNPQAVHGLSDLQKPGIRWINRQPGSGTRVWLDAQLQALGIDRAAIAGYDHAVVTHMGVAEAIHAGAATAGLGIRAAAAAYALHFVPLTQETYQLVVPQPVWETAVWQALLAIIRGSQFQEAVATLGGYTTVGMGTVQWL
ncbi:MAG: substrate-binding domain-containing protein, partial [Anaerolineales bacterium]|nr:substrate-binding domain-containing protein [Anaerolineales bacterium]